MNTTNENGPATPCMVCGKPMVDYDPMFCCSGFDCACYGLPTNPPVCSAECHDKAFTKNAIRIEKNSP